jgi:hypothetical protein
MENEEIQAKANNEEMANCMRAYRSKIICCW